jgi:trk system potassium uptake protein TrkH
LLLTGLAAGGLVLEHGFYELPVALPVIHLAEAAALVLYFVDVVYRSVRDKPPIPGQRVGWLDVLLMAVVVVSGLLRQFHQTSFESLVFEVSLALLFLSELWRFNVAMSRWLARPGLVLPLSFAILIGLGTPLLKLPVAVPVGQSLSWLDSWFTITSAVCVTGLTVRTTATQFTPFGQTVIAVFIQLGGLGIIIFGSMLAMVFGGGLSLRENLNLSQMLNDLPLRRLSSFVRFIVVTTLGIELAGAALMYPMWEDPVGGALTVGQRTGLSVFHAVSAFCNAGFDITGDSMVAYRYSALTHGVVALLIVVGGIGFPVLDNVARVVAGRLRQRLRRHAGTAERSVDLASRRMSLHAKVVLTTTACLYLYGVVTIAAGQLMPYVYEALDQGVTANAQEAGELTLAKAGGIVADASFMSITSRTAGFNSMPMDQLQGAGRFAVVTLMMVGGSPGSTAGGFKTTVLALLVLSVVATIRQRRETEVFGRAVSDSLVRKAGTLVICYLSMMTFSTLLLTLSEPYPFEMLFFEVVSAAATVGLSLGITADLTSFGKVVIIATMFLGRVGPLALLGALVFRRRIERPYAYPHEDVVLG